MKDFRREEEINEYFRLSIRHPTCRTAGLTNWEFALVFLHNAQIFRLLLKISVEGNSCMSL